MSKKTVGIILFVLACLFAILLISPLFSPGTIIDVVDGEAQVHIETDREWVAFPWDCYTISWRVFGTASVYLDGGGVIGEYTRPVCIEWKNAPTFQIDHVYTINKTDGTSRNFILPQRALTGHIEFWIGLVLVIGLVFVADRLNGTPWRSKGLERQMAKLPASRLCLLPEKTLPKRQQQVVIVALIIIFAAGLAMRLYHVYMLGESNYPAWAWRNNFGGLTQVYLALIGPYKAQLVEGGRIFYPPGYLLVLQIAQGLGLDLTALRILQALWDICSVFPLYWLLRRLQATTWLAVLGTLIYAIYPPWVIGSTFILGEWITSSLIIWLMWSLLFATDNKKLWSWVVVGLIAGIAAAFRSDTLPIIGLIGLWLLFQRLKWRRLMMSAFALGASFVIILAAAGFYNLVQFGRFTISSTAGGYALWSGLGMIPNDYGYFVSDGRAAQLVASMGMTYNSFEANSYFMDEYLRAWRERPSYVLSTIVYRWFKVVTEQEWWLTRWSQLPDYELLTLGVKAISAVGLTCTIAACVLSRRYPKRLLCILFPLLSALLTIGLVYYESRYVRYVGLSYLISFVLLLDWVYSYLARTIYYWRQRWQSQFINIALTSLIIVLALYLGLPHLSHVWSLVAHERQLRQAQSTFIPEDHTPAYTLSNLNWQTVWDGTHFEDQWLVAPNSGGLEFSLNSDIPLADSQFVIVHVEVEWISGIGYAALVDTNQQQRDQVTIQDPNSGTFDLMAYTADLDFITLAFTAIGTPGNVAIRINSVSVYTIP